MLRAQLAGGCLVADVGALEAETLREHFKRWSTEEAPWWALSFTLHLALLSSLLLFGSRTVGLDEGDQAVLGPAEAGAAEAVPALDPTPPVMPSIEKLLEKESLELNLNVPPPMLAHSDPGWSDANAPVAPRDLPPGPGGGDPNSKEILGTIPPSSGFSDGPANKGVWLGPQLATGAGPFFGPGGLGPGGFGRRQLIVGPDVPPKQLDAIVYALHWLARHQLHDGNWSLQHYADRCKDATCTGPGAVESEVAATALGTLPFLAAGQTHLSRGTYQKTVATAIGWLLRHQKADGDLREGSTMYAHALATITLCEACGMTGDRAVGYAAQRAVTFIQNAQNTTTGGWRYQPGEEGDLSVLGWQVMALRSAQMAGLKVDAAVLERAKTFLQTVASPNPNGGSTSSSQSGGLFAYTPGSRASTTMTSVGLLCHQYLGMRRDDPLMVAGTAHLLDNLPDNTVRDVYYWYYASQVMHNQPGPDWDAWKRKMRRALIESQDREGCAAGSWDPYRPATDRWGVQGGRLMMTSLATLTLEVPFRYLPLYKLDGKEERD
jgi:hypothetical protein